MNGSGGNGRPIDRSKLPRVAAVDANVLMRALEPHFADQFAVACRDFWTAMLEDKNRQIIIPAPSVAEHLRGRVSPLPSTEQVYVVPFDRVCAELLAERLPREVMAIQLKQFRKEYGASGAYIKYDAMIVACAKRWGANCIVSIDGRVKTQLAAAMPISCMVPSEFYDTNPQQLSLSVPAPPRLKSVPPPESSEPESSGS